VVVVVVVVSQVLMWMTWMMFEHDYLHHRLVFSLVHEDIDAVIENQRMDEVDFLQRE
jgi:hypothetical protein